ncbi:MAG TPA: DmsE family decaheme c-type cytochrome [Acidisarcina sp.]|nr:DmsE family decaheme c-type cytochrome [Acidisarcina sp.]
MSLKKIAFHIWPLIFLAIALWPHSPQAVYANQRKNLSEAHPSGSTGAANTRVGAEVCSTCHTDQANDFRHAFHAQQGLTCEDCHGAGGLHVEGGGDTSKIISFSKMKAREANAACLNCHAKSEHTQNWLAGAHARNGVRCSDCHQMHAEARSKDAAYRFKLGTLTPQKSASPENLVGESRRSTESLADSNETCLRCHQAERAQMNQPYHHPLREGKVGCKDCHNPHGGPGGTNLRTSTPNELCLKCHAQYRGPFAYQHAPVTENCLTCHSPHGSPNAGMVNVSLPALCLQCHNAHDNMGAAPTLDRCTNCHSSIHGTDVASKTGGSYFLDASPYGAPILPSQSSLTVPSQATRSHATALPAMAASITGLATIVPEIYGIRAHSQHAGAMPGAESVATATHDSAISTATSYRILSSTGFRGRVGEYDSLEEYAGADFKQASVFLNKHTALTSHAKIISSDDYNIGAELTASNRAQVRFNTRGLVQQQDTRRLQQLINTYPFPDPAGIHIIDGIPEGSVYGIKRRLGDVSGRLKLPKQYLELFVNGNWQARVGTTQLHYFDQNAAGPYNSGCIVCHWSSQYQPVNQTTRGVSGGARLNLKQASVTWQHGYSSFNDRMQFPVGSFGAMDTTGLSVPDTSPVADGNYYIQIPSPNSSSSDSVNANWSIAHNLSANGDVSYVRFLDRYLKHKSNSVNANATVSWLPNARIGVIADYHEQSFVNDFVPYFSLFGNVSHHKHWEGIKTTLDLTQHLNADLYYKHSGITRSNAAKWPQAYSIDNTDWMLVVPVTTDNTGGLALRYNRAMLGTRVGYEYTNTHQPGYIVTPGSESRVFLRNTFTPTRFLTLTNDFNARVQNAFPSAGHYTSLAPFPGDTTVASESILRQRRDRFYNETLSLAVPLEQHGNVSVGYSYQQNKLKTFMDFNEYQFLNMDYLLREPLVPYNQLSQTYWGQVTTTFLQHRLGVDGKVTYNSARSHMSPDVNPNHAVKFGNGSLIQQGYCDDSAWGGNYYVPGTNSCFSQNNILLALQEATVSSTKISAVNVPQWIGHGKVFYRLPLNFSAGLDVDYGSYRDYWNPELNGDLRSFTLYVGRSW